MMTSLNSQPDSAVPANDLRAKVSVTALWNFRELVTELGGYPDELLRREQIDPEILHGQDNFMDYRKVVNVLERAAAELDCPDFGMRLAVAQRGEKGLGPFGVVMKNSKTVRDAYEYCVKHHHAYCPGAKMIVEDWTSEQGSQSIFVGFEIILALLPFKRQAVEQAVLLTLQAAADLSGRHVLAKEVWFSHGRLAPRATYRKHFASAIRFEQPLNGLFFSELSLRYPVVSPDPHQYDLATNFIRNRFPVPTRTITGQVRMMIKRRLRDSECTIEQIALSLCMHPRTLQRRLRMENQGFEAIKDEVRRDLAMQYLVRRDLAFTRVAELLGYSESSVLTRSCHRWFLNSPSRVRHDLVKGNSSKLDACYNTGQ